VQEPARRWRRPRARLARARDRPSGGYRSSPRRGRDKRRGAAARHQDLALAARRVRDFAWGRFPRLRWTRPPERRPDRTFYRPNAAPWEEANRMAWFTIKHFSETWGDVPVAARHTVEGLVEGMEYPMLTFVPPSKSARSVLGLTPRIRHEWFPMMVGSDERPLSLDGPRGSTASSITARRGLLQGHGVRRHGAAGAAHRIRGLGRPRKRAALITNPVEVARSGLGPRTRSRADAHGAAGRGPRKRTFGARCAEYVRRWTFKHPQPRTLPHHRDVSGRNLDGSGAPGCHPARLDQAVDSVGTAGDTTFVFLSNRDRWSCR